MWKTGILLLSLCSFCVFSQTTRTLDLPLSRETEAFSSFTDNDLYNSYNFCNSPVGIFDHDSIRLRAHCNLDLIRWHATMQHNSLVRKYTAWYVPDILFEKPKIFAIRLFYEPTSINDETDVTQTRSLFLNRFGLTMASQAHSGVFQFGLSSKGYIGKEELGSSSNNRLIMGLDDLTITLGSRFHELWAIGMRGGVVAKFDSLRDFSPSPTSDRYFSGQIPLLEWYIIFGKTDFPVQSDFSVTTTTSRFVYVSDTNISMNPIRGDSLALKWQLLGNLHEGGITYHPAILLSYWNNSYQEYQPTPANNSLSVGQKLPGADRQLSDFRIGIGTSIAIRHFASAWVEYTHPSMRLQYGNNWQNLKDKNEGYHRTSLGVQANLHTIPALGFSPSVESMFRIGYFNQTENSGINPFEGDVFGLMTPVSTLSQAYRYSPDFGWGPLERVSGITLGLAGTFFDKRLESDMHVCFLSMTGSVKNSGTAWGLDIAYLLH